jgi:HSP20 family protein
MSVKKINRKGFGEKRKPSIAPTTDVDHDNKFYYIQVELPGVHKEDVELTVADQSFCVRGTREESEFFGCFALAHPANTEEAVAVYDNGLLSIEIPLKAPGKEKKIQIE